MEAGKGKQTPGVWTASLLSLSPEETFRVGQELGASIADACTDRLGKKATAFRDGVVLALVGELGSGKTVFTKGLAAGIGVSDRAGVTSPTFVLRQDYDGRLRIHHYDVYRLSGPPELLALGFEEDIRPGAVVAVEWADRVLEAIPPDALFVELEHGEGGAQVPGSLPSDSCRRRITFRGDPGIWRDLVDRMLTLKFPLRIIR